MLIFKGCLFLKVYGITEFYENLFYKIVQGIYSVNIEKQLISMRKFKKLLAEEQVPPIKQIINDSC